MVTINKINSISTFSTKTKSIQKAAIPCTTGLSILAGSSLGGGFPPPNVTNVPGSSINDSVLDQLQHTGDMMLDFGQEVSSTITEGASSIADHIVDFIGDALDLFS